MTPTRLPIGIQTFREIREAGHRYVDKTAHLRRLFNAGKHILLTRPRRFGKSLFLDTCRNLFEGNEGLFRGLDIHRHWDWSVRHPTLRLTFGAGDFTDPRSLPVQLASQLEAAERRFGLSSDAACGPQRLAGLVAALHRRTGRPVAILVDEYDNPVDALGHLPTARANCDSLRRLYAVFEEADPHIAFTLFTGVSNLAKSSLFAGVEDLVDITLDPAFATVCGFTERELDTAFAAELAGLDRSAIRESYLGYRWLGERVYNPWDILLLLRRRRFGPHWCETGSPSLLVRRIIDGRLGSSALGNMTADGDLLRTLDVDHTPTEALLFQTGYLTIAGKTDLPGKPIYRLAYPNRVVRQNLHESVLRHLVKDTTRQMANLLRLHELLEVNDLEGLRSLFQAFFADIPDERYKSAEVAGHDAFCTSVFHSYFASLGLDITVEGDDGDGRLDMAVRFGDRVYVFGFSVVEAPRSGAAAPPRTTHRADRYRDAGNTVVLIDVQFSMATREVVGFEVH